MKSPLPLLLAAVVLLGCAEDRVLALQGPPGACEADRTIRLADGAGSGIESIANGREGWAVLFADDRVTKLAEISPDGALVAGPFELGLRADISAPVAIRDGDGYRVVYGVREGMVDRIVSATLSDDDPDAGLTGQRDAAPLDGISNHRLGPPPRARQRFLAWRDNAVVFVSPFEDGFAASPVAFDGEWGMGTPAAIEADADGIWVLVDGGSDWIVLHRAVDGTPLREDLVFIADATDLAANDDGAWLAQAVDDTLEVRSLKPARDAPDAVIGTPDGVTALDLDVILRVGWVLAWADGSGVSVEFSDGGEPLRIDADRVTGLRVRGFDGGALVALERNEPDRAELHVLCRADDG